MPRIEYEHLEQIEDPSATSDEAFDRVAFAERVLALVRPRRTTVAICPGSRHVHVTMGRQWGSGADARWAVLSFPANASRRAIAQAVLELATPDVRPWTLDVVLHVCEGPEERGGPYR